MSATLRYDAENVERLQFEHSGSSITVKIPLEKIGTLQTFNLKALLRGSVAWNKPVVDRIPDAGWATIKWEGNIE